MGIRERSVGLALALGCLPGAMQRAAAPQTTSLASIVAPLILDIDGDGLHLRPPREGVLFDLLGDGVTSPVGWTRAGSDDVFLANDFTHDGRLNGGLELVSGAEVGPNAFAALAQFDSNRDGSVDANDVAFREELLCWRDDNHNGRSEPDELFHPSTLGVVALRLGYEAVSEPDEFGNVVVFKGQALVNNRQAVPTFRWLTAVRLARGD
jgi:hypothetical protein